MYVYERVDAHVDEVANFLAVGENNRVIVIVYDKTALCNFGVEAQRRNVRDIGGICLKEGEKREY